MLKSPEDMHAAVIKNLPETTGRSLADWLKVARTLPVEPGPVAEPGSKPVRALGSTLQDVHGDLGSVQARCIAWEALRPAGYVAPSEGQLVDAQYSGAKAPLRPIYDAIVEAVAGLGPDASIAPRKTQVTLSRGRTFGIVKAATKSRVDLGLRLPDLPGTDAGRLEAGDHFSGNTTHRVKLQSPSEVNAELVGWVRQAYESRA